MACVLGIDAVFHDLPAALPVDEWDVAAAEADLPGARQEWRPPDEQRSAEGAA